MCACMPSHFSHVQISAASMDCSPPGSSVRGILQARILEWVAVPSFRGFLTQGSNPHLLHCWWILLPAEPPEKRLSPTPSCKLHEGIGGFEISCRLINSSWACGQTSDCWEGTWQCPEWEKNLLMANIFTGLYNSAHDLRVIFIANVYLDLCNKRWGNWSENLYNLKSHSLWVTELHFFSVVKYA